MSDSPFSKRTLRVLYGLGAASLLAGFLGAVLWPGTPGVSSPDADTFSSSAIGHRAFYELLQETGRRVIRSRGQTARKVGDAGLLVLLEPKCEPHRIEEMIESVPRALVVLPKWYGHEDPRHRGWLDAVALLEPDVVKRTLDAVAVRARLVRDPVLAGAWHGAEAPTVTNLQLVYAAQSPTPEIYTDDGMLLGRVDRASGARIWVLSDPDVLSNHGLGKGRNAELVLDMLARIAPGDAPIVIDETLHGYAVPPHIWGELARFPLVFALAQGLLAIFVLVWAGASRFGAPEPEQIGLGSGKALLIHNTGDLLRFGGHSASVLSRYLAVEMRRVAGAFHLPPGSTDADLESRLTRLEAGRVSRSLAEVKALVAAAGTSSTGVEASALRTAQVVWKWREEMLGGT